MYVISVAENLFVNLNLKLRCGQRAEREERFPDLIEELVKPSSGCMEAKVAESSSVRESF